MPAHSVREVAQAHAAAVAGVVEGEDPVNVDVGGHHGVQGVAQSAGQAQFRPGDGFALGVGFGAVAPGQHEAAVQAEGDAGEDVSCDGGEDEQWFERVGLVVWSGEEEGFVGGE